MAASEHASVWEGVDCEPTAPTHCPHCGEALAHPTDLRNNDDIDASGTFAAYRRHRWAHIPWGDDPREHTSIRGDPYLAAFYGEGRDATTDDYGGGDPDEVVGAVYDVRISYETELRATVVAPTEHRAKEKAKDMNVFNEKDLSGTVPQFYRQYEIHGRASKRDDVTRADGRAERMDGWPW